LTGGTYTCYNRYWTFTNLCDNKKKEIMGEKKEKKVELIQIGSRLKKIKLHFSYNRGHISKIMGISPITYTRNESGEQLPTTRSIMALHIRLGVSLE
jgi:hypothetical protein